MAYDFAGPWSHQPVHHAALYPDSNTPGAASADSAIQYLLAQPNVSPRKIVLGVPCYGRAFAHAPNTIPPLSATDRSREDHGRAIEVRDLPLPGAGEYVDERACAAYCLPEDGNGEWVSYDNPTTVAAKARYVRERNLGGLVFWEACQDHQAEERSLVLAGYVGLYGLGVGMGKIENVASK
jgi:chitinase